MSPLSMSSLRLEPAFQDADRFYAALIAAIDGAPSEQEALRLLARLTLILANQVASDSLLLEALALAERPGPGPDAPS